MDSQTYQEMPQDVKEALGDDVGIDESIPTGQVEIRYDKPEPRQKKRTQAKRLTSEAFIREVRKRERQNRKKGRQQK